MSLDTADGMTLPIIREMPTWEFPVFVVSGGSIPKEEGECDEQLESSMVMETISNYLVDLASDTESSD